MGAKYTRVTKRGKVDREGRRRRERKGERGREERREIRV